MQALDGNSSLPYLEPLIHNGLGARAKLRMISVVWVGGRGGGRWFSGRGRNRAGMGQRSWLGSGQSGERLRGGVALVFGWHVRGRVAIGPAWSSVGRGDRPALRCQT